MDELEQKIINLEEENLKLKQGNQELERKIEILHRNISSRSPGYQAKHQLLGVRVAKHGNRVCLSSLPLNLVSFLKTSKILTFKFYFF